MKVFTILISILCISVMASCTKDIGANPDLITKTGCDTVTFTKHIMPIFTSECISCHSTTGGQSPDLSDYTLIKSSVDAGRIQARMIDGTPSFMPTAGRLPDTQINLLKCWLDAGAPNN